MSEELLPCPFCGAGTFDIRENGKIWMGQKYSEPSSVSVFHWCEEVKGQPSRAIERVGRDRASAIEAWNRRAAVDLASLEAVPDGWKLVPVEPTQEMLDAVVTTTDEFLLGKDAEKQYRDDWSAMLSAAPAQPAQQERQPMTDDRETRTMKLIGFLDDLIEADPDRAERLIESILARNALRKRLAERHRGIRKE